MRRPVALIVLAFACESQPAPQSAPTPPVGVVIVPPLPNPNAPPPEVPPPTSPIVAAVEAQFPQYRFSHYRPIDSTPSPLSAAFMVFRSKSADWPAGTALVVWEGSAPPIWVLEHRGDFGPHTLSWFDANKDGAVDLLVFSGEEDVFESELLLRSPVTARSGIAFTRAFVDTTQYVTVLDLDRDGEIEFIGGVHVRDSTGQVARGCEFTSLPQWANDSAMARYQAAREVPGMRNFAYGMPSIYTTRMHADKPLAIWQLRAGRLVDVTRRFPDEIRWRIAAVEQTSMPSELEGSCAPYNRLVAAHLRSLLEPAR